MEVRSIVALAAGLVVLGAGAVQASNMAFLVRYQLTYDAGGASNLHWVSIPYHYQPPDVNGNGVVDAEDLIQDLQPRAYTRPCQVGSSGPDVCAVYQVWRWDESTGSYQTYRLNDFGTGLFTLTPGEAYGLDIQAVGSNTTHDLELVGGNDPTFQLQYCFDPSADNSHWFSLPPNLMIPDSNGNGQVDAEDLGQAMGGPDWIYQIRRYDTATGLQQVWRVGSAFGTPFTIDATEGYILDLTCPNTSGGCTSPGSDPCTWTWSPPHY